MSRSSSIIVGAVASLGVLVGSSTAAAAVLYSNGGLNGTVGGFTIAWGLAVSDSFTLTQTVTITSVNFGVWLFPGDTVSTVDWAITPAYDSFADAGVAGVNNGAYSINGWGYAVGVDSFSTGAVTLGPGTYYLVLQNAAATYGDPVYWDENDGPSSATEDLLGDLSDYNIPGADSEFFQINGWNSYSYAFAPAAQTLAPSIAMVPEPASWALTLVGLAGLGATLRGARRPRGA